MLKDLPVENQQFRLLHVKIRQEMHSRYQEAVPEKLVSTPYSGKAHGGHFSLLQENLAQPVPAAAPRIVAGDNTHTGRRVRELRSLKLDFDMIPAIVRNNARRTSMLTQDEKQHILRNAGIPENG
ncbi:hypothetical protein [Streptomyces atratus]|nr:hypothetical protein [Streptomyces atratus]